MSRSTNRLVILSFYRVLSGGTIFVYRVLFDRVVYSFSLVVAIQTNKKKGKIEINDIRSVHYRNSNAHMANWINEGLLEYANKKRMAEWFSKQRSNSADVRKQFNHSVKIVETFENQIVEGLNHQDAGGDTGQDARDIPRYHIEAERSEKAGRNVISSNQASSGADTSGL